MDIGVKISGTTHAILIGIAIFGAPIFSSDKENPIQISEVSLISSEDFAALTSSNIPILKQPEPVVEEPEPVVEELEPVVEEPEPVVEEPEPVVEEPEPVVEEPEPVVEEPEPVVEEIISDSEENPIAPISTEDNIGELNQETNESAPPKPAKVISNIAVEAPKETIKPEMKPEPSVVEVEKKDEQVKELEIKPSAAAEESSTKIVTEAEEQKSELVPSSTSKPKSRPKNLKVIKEIKTKPKIKKQKESDLIKDAIAAEIAEKEIKDLEEPKKPISQPLTKEEEQNLVLNIRQCWNVPVGLENDSSNVIIMGIKLSIDGNLEEDPVNLSPNSGVGMIQAYEAARRAVLRCQPYKLPADKYETWREMEIELDPSEMVLR